VITSEEYKARLRKMKINIIVNGERVEDVTTHPSLALGINTIARTYDCAHEPEFRHLATATSHLTGETINRFDHVNRSREDLMTKIELVRALARQVGGCNQRCVGTDALNAVSVVSYALDQEYGTEYFSRFEEYLRYVQQNDLCLAGAVTDVKGDRSLKCHEQADPDLNLHVVERRRDGIVVRGAKMHITMAPYADELMVIPTQFRGEADADWAVCFAIPTDAKGITQICNGGHVRPRRMEKPFSSRYQGSHSMVVFDDVFVPWERVFMCGEWRYSGWLARLFGDFHRHTYCGCKPAYTDLIMGAAALAAEYNNLEKASHIRDKLFQLIYHAESIYACGVASATLAQKMPSGTYLPDVTIANMGKYHAGLSIHEEIAILQNIAGGLSFTVPSDADYFDNPVSHAYIEKYLKGKADVATEDRLRCFHLCNDLCHSEVATFTMNAGVIGAGPAQAQRITVLADYDLESRKRWAKEIAGIKG